MPLVLHVLGPAYGLPSIDAECTAAVALLKLRYGNEQNIWTIKRTHSSPNTLPLLIDGTKSISGYSSICRHLQGQLNPDAEEIATTALIQARAPVLIAAYLYLSYENYSTTTRPAFTPILPLYARFTIPAALRTAAKETTKPFGIASLDVEALDDKHASSDDKLGAAESTFEASAKNRASLVLPKINTVRSMLAQKPEAMAAFKLHSLADGLLEPLTDLLGAKDYLSGDTEPGQIDCLAYAYLALMLKPHVPQPWLARIVRTRYPKLIAYHERIESTLGLNSAAALPWTEPVVASVQGVLVDLLNVLGDQTMTRSNAVVLSTDGPSSSWSKHLPLVLLTAGSAMVAGVSWALLPLLTASRGDPVHIFGGMRATNFDHLSSALSGLSFSMPHHHPHVISDNDAPAQVGIEIES